MQRLGEPQLTRTLMSLAYPLLCLSVHSANACLGLAWNTSRPDNQETCEGLRGCMVWSLGRYMMPSATHLGPPQLLLVLLPQQLVCKAAGCCQQHQQGSCKDSHDEWRS